MGAILDPKLTIGNSFVYSLTLPEGACTSR
jgi:hypothetical protein